MNNTRHRPAILLAAGAMLLSITLPAAAQQGYNTLDNPANRAINRQIINRAILRQATQGRGSRSHRAARHRSRSHAAKRHHG